MFHALNGAFSHTDMNRVADDEEVALDVSPVKRARKGGKRSGTNTRTKRDAKRADDAVVIDDVPPPPDMDVDEPCVREEDDHRYSQQDELVVVNEMGWSYDEESSPSPPQMIRFDNPPASPSVSPRPRYEPRYEPRHEPSSTGHYEAVRTDLVRQLTIDYGAQECRSDIEAAVNRVVTKAYLLVMVKREF